MTTGTWASKPAGSPRQAGPGRSFRHQVVGTAGRAATGTWAGIQATTKTGAVPEPAALSPWEEGATARGCFTELWGGGPLRKGRAEHRQRQGAGSTMTPWREASQLPHGSRPSTLMLRATRQGTRQGLHTHEPSQRSMCPPPSTTMQSVSH